MSAGERGYRVAIIALLCVITGVAVSTILPVGSAVEQVAWALLLGAMFFALVSGLARFISALAGPETDGR